MVTHIFENLKICFHIDLVRPQWNMVRKIEVNKLILQMWKVSREKICSFDQTIWFIKGFNPIHYTLMESVLFKESLYK